MPFARAAWYNRGIMRLSREQFGPLALPQAARRAWSLRAWRALDALRDSRLWLLVGLCLALLLVASQAPLSYRFQVGQQTGPLSDQPFLASFLPGEGSGTARFRWSRPDSTITIPAVGRRALILTLPIIGHRAQFEPDAQPTIVELRAAGGPSFAFPLRREGASYRVYLPPAASPNGTLRLRLISAPWSSPGDKRGQLGVALGQRIGLESVQPTGFVLPDNALLLAWPLCLGLLWLSLETLGFGRRRMFWLLVPLVLGLPLLLLIDAPRLGFGSLWALQVGALTLVAALLARLALPALLRRLGVPAPAHLLPWLLLLIVATFALKYGGRLYPDAMPGDLQLHVNRYSMAVAGNIYIPAQHRGLPFPFPPALYISLAPLTLSGLDIRPLFEISAGLFEAGTVLLLYILLARVFSPRLGLLAAGLYALIAAGFMVTWFAFQTQVAAHFFTTALIAALVLWWPRYAGWTRWLVIVFLIAQAFLGHIGQFLNAGLVGLLAVPLLYLGARSAAERAGARRFALIGLAAGLFCGLFYYSAFWSLIVEQTREVAALGLNEATGKPPIPRATTLSVLWRGGLIEHLGFFPAPLALIGALLLARKRPPGILSLLVALTFVVALSQGLLPLLTLSSITTRWLMFTVWAIVACAALALVPLWRRGRVARLVTVTMGGYLAWLTLVLFLNALALRKPPIEPF
jgi:hypothetical protein